MLSKTFSKYEIRSHGIFNFASLPSSDVGKFGCTKKLLWGDLDKNENLQKRILLTHGMIFDHFSLAAILTEMNNLEWVVHVFDPLGSKN